MAHGLNVAGFLRSEIGIGEAARQILTALESTDVPHVTIAHLGPTLSRKGYPALRGRSEPVFDTNLVCVNAHSLPFFADEVGPQFFEGRYSIGFWFWEVSEFPESMVGAFDLVDEVWVASDYARAPIAAKTTKPVRKVPVPIAPPNDARGDRARFGLPDGFAFLFTFNFHSVFERKNPVATIDAFTRAFAPDEGPLLVVKSANGDKFPELFERMRAAAAGRDDVILLDGYFSVEDQQALMASCDCYVSLHRSEGWGLGMAEAMALGKPVIATAYSGNLEFMDETNGYLIPYEPTSVPEGAAPYPAGAEWADPDVDAAAKAMRAVVDDPARARKLADAGRRSVLDRLSPERTGAAIQARLREIWDDRGATPQHATSHRGSAVERLLEELSRAPEEAFATGGRGPTSFMRRALARALWPYLRRQRELDTLLVEAIRELEYELHELSARLDERDR